MENPFKIILEKLDCIEEKLNRLEQNKGAQFDLMDIETLGKYINYQKTSIYGLVQKNKIPYIKRGKLFFEKGEIDKWLINGRKITKEEIKLKADEYLINNSSASSH